MNPKSIAGQALSLAEGAARTGLSAANGAAGAVRRRLQGAPDADDRAAIPKSELTDTALARKVESELFRDTKAVKGKVDVNAVGRVVYLRGEVKNPAMVKELEARTLSIPEVGRVENLLHLPKTPAPSRGDTPPRQRKTRQTKGTAAARKRTPARVVNSEKPAPGAEPGPRELAEKGEGRQPAPLGSTGSSDGGGADEAATGRS